MAPIAAAKRIMGWSRGMMIRGSFTRKLAPSTSPASRSSGEILAAPGSRPPGGSPIAPTRRNVRITGHDTVITGHNFFTVDCDVFLAHWEVFLVD
jgi:hypothetical protein